MKVLRIITRLNIGGPSIQAARLTTELAARGHETTLVHGRPGADEGDMRDLLPAGASNVIYVDALQRPIAPVSDVRALRTILATLRTVRPDIVHTHMAKAGLLGRLATIIYNRTTGRPRPARIVHTYHGHVLEGYFQPAVADAFVRLERWLARFSDVLIAVSPRVRDELVNRFRIAPAAKFHVIPLGFDLAPLAAITDADRVAARRQLNLPDRALVVTTVGRLTAIKNHELLLEAARQVVSTTPDATWLIAGDGELRETLKARSDALGLADRVRWLGWRRDLETVYAAADLFVLTSRNEGTPVALIEAMAAGVPCIATNVGGVADVLTDERLGLTVDSGDGGALASGINRLLSSAALRRDIGADARASVLQRYNIGRLVDDMERLYRSLKSEV